FSGVYKKLLFNHAGTRLLGGVLVGDAQDYGVLAALAKGETPLPCKPHELLMGKASGPAMAGGVASLPETAQICACNNVTKGALCTAISDQGLTSVSQVKAGTKAGTGCGGCLPLVTEVLNATLESTGQAVSHDLCEHFAYTRTELFAMVKAKRMQTFDALLAYCGRGTGCEICKPAVTSILASLWNEPIMQSEHQTLQDTNDRFLANMQRGGLYSVVPRVPGGEITPDKLIALGETARQYGLYTKITGAQRIDLFGAQVQDLPNIWEQLIDAGFESGHAYGKALRTVKSCVGTTWCRYGVQDSVGFAIRVENRYKGVRAPHKIKSAVSGCIRECAEAQSKDFGLVATERGYNLYVCGNGGARPRHADLLATDLDEDTAIKYIDRFLMYYMMTADRLTRTAVWLDKLEGGLVHLKEVILADKLGICAELEAMMQSLVDSYACEWAAVVNNPEQRQRFRQFVNTDETEPCIEIISERGQQRPGDWPSEAVSLAQFTVLQEHTKTTAAQARTAPRSWVPVGTVADFPPNGGATIKYGKVQIAVFNFASQGTWYACQQMCPHKKAFVLSRGIIGDTNSIPKVACPLHKKTFSLESGACLSGESYTVEVFPVRVEGNVVSLELPAPDMLDALLATDVGCHLATARDTMLEPVAG
ncbi:MAG: nitrite reductase small subunit NirD, partial [Candidatus Tectomicrobia bacterium]|nr:nitrite reductase small subunit NirD [Candidatus Tectomicrobia bacterium]